MNTNQININKMKTNQMKTKGIIQTKGLKRNTIDKYYTKPNAVTTCLQYVNTNIGVSNTDLIIEPSAGNGAFISGIKKMTTNCLFYDLEPENEEIIKQDYLMLNTNNIREKFNTKTIHVIGNPPFGRQSSIAIKFIKKSCEFSDSVSFILPKSFKKDSLQKSFPLCFHLLFEIDIPDNSFLVDGVEHDVPCVFQIWQKKDFDRQVSEKLEPRNFVFVDKNETPDISFRRVGVNAGKIDKNIEEKSIQSHYFIRFTNKKSVDENILLLSSINYEFNNTVGPKSISKQELISKFNPLLV